MKHNLKISDSAEPTTLNFRATFHDTRNKTFIILEELISICKKHGVDFISTDLNDPKDNKK